MTFSDAELEAACARLTEPDRLRDAQRRVADIAPQLQLILGRALQEAGWVGGEQEKQVRSAAAATNEDERVTAVRTMLAEEARIGMLVGVAVGWELARELEIDISGIPDGTPADDRGD